MLKLRIFVVKGNKFGLWVTPLVGRHVIKTQLKFEIAGIIVAIAKKKFKNQGFLFTGFVPTGWAPCCETWLKEKKLSENCYWMQK